MLSLATWLLAFSALTLFVIGGLTCCLRQRIVVARRVGRESADAESAKAGSVVEEE